MMAYRCNHRVCIGPTEFASALTVCACLLLLSCRIRWGLDTDTELLDVLLQGVMDGKSGLDLWEYTAETMFGDVTRAMALQQRLVKLTTALHWFDFEQSKVCGACVGGWQGGSGLGFAWWLAGWLNG